MAQRKWIPRACRKGDEEEIFELSKAVYPDKEYDHDKWISWQHWFYKANPAGRSYILLAEDNGKVVE